MCESEHLITCVKQIATCILRDIIYIRGTRKSISSILYKFKQGQSYPFIRGFIWIPLDKKLYCIYLIKIIYIYMYIVDIKLSSTSSCVYLFRFWTLLLTIPASLLSLSVYLCTPKVRGPKWSWDQVKRHIYILCLSKMKIELKVI